MNIYMYFLLCLSIVSSHAEATRQRGIEKKFPLWTMVNSVDDSRHYLMGTVHRMGLTLADLQPYLQALVDKADTLIGETDPADSTAIAHYRDPFSAYYRAPTGDNLPARLGSEHWAKAQDILSDISENRPQVLKNLSFAKIEKLDAATMSGVIGSAAREAAYGSTDHPSLDEQIASLGEKRGKELVGLETRDALGEHLKQAYEADVAHLRRIDPDGELQMQRLRAMINEGGINYWRDRYLKIREDYLNGDVFTAISAMNNAFNPHSVESIVDARNLAWIESGKIQDLCWKGNRCFIFVGLAHMIMHKRPLIALLQEHGFKVRRAAAAAQNRKNKD